ncbi:hypothetical protein AB0M44_40075 [Streptosporangium subroseum]|uniref:hypothetical protein n=1 Tax=Streptosporangium subroseum TaxID=106412 RepID=UPI003420B13C
MTHRLRRRRRLPAPICQEALQGYGVLTPIFNGQRIIGHGGGIGGGATNWSIYLDTDWVGVILSNYDLQIEPIISKERHAVTDHTAQSSR